MLIGRLTRDPELKYTAKNIAVCSFAVATNRSWTSPDTNEKQETVEFTNITAWTKLAEICGSLLHKGDRVYVEGRLETRKWTGDDNVERRNTGVVIENMILLQSSSDSDRSSDMSASAKPSKAKSSKVEIKDQNQDFDVEDVSDDVPF